jgi:hypothetical protein
MTEPISPFVPPPRPRAISVDAAEVTALRVILMACVTHLACNAEKSEGVSAQSWINNLSSLCQEAVLTSPIDVSEDRERNERFAARIIDHINLVLSGIKLPAGDGNKAN